MPNALDIQGHKFGRLTAISRAQVAGARNAMWLCKCECGGKIVVAASNLGRNTSSCGCLQVESATASLRKNRLAKEGQHGMSKWPEWQSWALMKQRCYNPRNAKYHRYGGRGIKICDRWLESFENFIADMGRKPSKQYTIGRIDNDGDYCKENCRWEMPATQARNTCTNHWITINSTRLCLEDWCIKLGIPRWKPYEMTRSRHGRLAKFHSIEAAIKHLHDHA